MNETIICNALNWDIDMITPINYVEAILSHVMDSSSRARIRELTYELIILCLTGKNISWNENLPCYIIFRCSLCRFICSIISNWLFVDGE